MLINRSIVKPITGSINRSITGSLSAGGSMQDVIASTVFDVDATMQGSYSGSGQTFSNLVTSPADGESQTAYNLQLGTTSSPSTDDPTFTGSAGDSGAYFLHDGGDTMSLVNTNANAPFFNDIHKGASGQAWWLAFAIRTPSSLATMSYINSTGFALSNYGLRVRTISSGAVEVILGQGGPGFFYSGPGGGVSTTDETLLIVTYDFDSDSLDIYINGSAYATGVTGATSTTTTAPTYDFRFSGIDSGSQRYLNGTRLYAMSGGNTKINSTQATAIKTEYESRHGRTY